MSDSIDTYITSGIFLLFISSYRKNLSGIFQVIPLEKCSPSSSHEEDGKPDSLASRIRSSPVMGSRHRPSAAQMFLYPPIDICYNNSRSEYSIGFPMILFFERRFPMNSFNNDMAWEREKSLSINMPGLMKDIYLWVAIALAITGFTAYTVAGSPMLLSLVFAGKFTMWALLIATVALVWHLSSAVARMSLKKAAAMYIIYAVLNGAMMASIFLVYTMTSIASVFFITAGTFAVMSAYGYLTKTDLSKMGNLCLMGLFGLIIATVVNLFLDNSFLEMILAYAGILIFVGLTAYDTKRIREIAFANNTNTTDEGVKLAILCALTLYLDFINLFIYMLRIFGEKK